MLTYRVTGFLRKRYDLPESSVSVSHNRQDQETGA